jgi:hypothetical protein
VTVAVIGGTLLSVGEDGIGFADLLEACLRICALVDVRV